MLRAAKYEEKCAESDMSFSKIINLRQKIHKNDEEYTRKIWIMRARSGSWQREWYLLENAIEEKMLGSRMQENNTEMEKLKVGWEIEEQFLDRSNAVDYLPEKKMTRE